MKTILSKILKKPFTQVNGEPMIEDEKIFDISNLKPQEMFDILNFMQNEIYDIDIYNINNPEFFFIIFRSKYIVTIPGLYEVYIVGIENNTLIFHGFKNPEGIKEMKIIIPYTTKYPIGFKVEIYTTHHLMEEFYQEILKGISK